MKLKFKKMEITIKDIQNNLKTLPEELFQNVNDYIEFLKAKYKNNGQNDLYELSIEQKNILDERLLESEEDYISAEDSITLLKQKYGV